MAAGRSATFSAKCDLEFRYASDALVKPSVPPHLLILTTESDTMMHQEITKSLFRPLGLLTVALFGSVLLVGPKTISDSQAEPLEFMVQADIGLRQVEGQPLAWSDEKVYLLGRDGQLVFFAPSEARDYRKSAPRFAGLSAIEMRQQLATEFGEDYEVSSTGHYLVVHPRGQRVIWAQKFEAMYRTFKHYFRVRGFELSEPQYPLVAIVFRTHSEYQQYSRREEANLSPDTLGHYSVRTNRVSLYDVTGGSKSRAAAENIDTVVHEATHQTAFNTGIHARFAGVPRWLCEGLASMFEPPGVWDPVNHSRRHDRINDQRFSEFERFVNERRQSGAMVEVIASDRPFKADPHGAYAEAWALSFFLSETRPKLYGEYLTRTAERPAFERYTAQQRVEDFRVVFGDDLETLEVQFLQYMDRLR